MGAAFGCYVFTIDRYLASEKRSENPTCFEDPEDEQNFWVLLNSLETRIPIVSELLGYALINLYKHDPRAFRAAYPIYFPNSPGR